MLTGILNINKSKNLTSHDVVDQVRKILNIKKIGHTGTLDPAATGVLVLCIGKTTRLIQYLPTDKEYIAEITLGISTDTYDSEGEIISKQKVNLDKDQLLNALKNFEGEITQQVPLASATHYKGKKLYEYSHKGIKIDDLPSKKVTINRIELLRISGETEDNPVITLEVDCSSGTYLRSIANDLGNILGYGAYLSNLIRTMSSGLKISDSLTIEELEKATENNTLNSLIVSPVDIIQLPKVQIGFGQISRINNGQYFRVQKELFDSDQRVLLINKNNEIAAIGEYSKMEQLIKPITVLM